MSRHNTVDYVRVGDRLVRLEQPAPTPRYDAYALMGAAFFGAMAGILLVTLLVVK